MTEKPTKTWFLKKILNMPQWFQHLLSWLGIYSEELEASIYLYASKELSSFPPAVRKHRIRRLIAGYYRGRDIGSHVPGFYPFLVPASSWVGYPEFILAKGMAPREAVLPVVECGTCAVKSSTISLGLHIHAFYVDGLADIRDAILQNKTLPELYITGPENIGDIVHQIMAAYPNVVHFVACENIGRDVVPFLKTLPIMRANGHDLIGHVHVKKSVGVNNEYFVRQWSDFLVSSMVGEPLSGAASIDNIAAHFKDSLEQPVLYLPHMSDPISWGVNRKIAEELFKFLHDGTLPDRFLFSPGTMFWATPDYLRPFESLNIPWELLAQEPLPPDGTVLHAIERLFGALAFARQDPVAICVPKAVSFIHSQSLMQIKR